MKFFTMHTNEIELYRYKLHLYFNILGCIAAFIFSLLQFMREDYITGSISVTGGIYFITVVYFLKKKSKYLWKGRGYIIWVPITIINTIHIHPEYGIYWAFVGVISFFLLLDFKDACISVFAFNTIIFYIINLNYPLPVQLRIYATLTIVSLFSLIFTILINRLIETLNTLITKDSLTKALNRHSFLSSIEETLYSSLRYKTPASLFIFDLDFFKKINDNHGHLKGDEVLCRLTEVIQHRLRDSDKLFRYGGEEFALLLAHTTEKDAILLAEELRTLAEQQDYDIGHPVTISGGVSAARSSDTANAWIERCDKALYQAKSSGRNAVLIAK